MGKLGASLPGSRPASLSQAVLQPAALQGKP